MHGPSFATPAAPGAAPKHGPSAGRPAKPADKPDDGAGLRVLTYLRLHWLMILFCGSLLSTAGAFLAWDLLASKYESYAMLQVSSVPTTIANHNNPNQARTDFATYVRTTAALINKEFVLNAALRDIKDTATIKAQADPIKFLEEELLVSWQDGSEVIRISFKGHDPQDAKKIVDAVQKAFMSEVIQKDVTEKKALMTKVEEAQRELKRILTDGFVKKQPGAVAPPADGALPAAAVAPVGGGGPAGGAAPPAGGGAADEDALIDRLAHLDQHVLISSVVQLKEQQHQLPITIGDLKRRAKYLDEQLELVKAAPIPPATLDQVDNDPAVTRARVLAGRAKMDYLSALNSASDPKNPAPKVLQFKSIAESMDKEWQDVRTAKLNTIDGAQRNKETSLLILERNDVGRKINLYTEQLALIKVRLDKATKVLYDLPMATNKDGGGLFAGRLDADGYKTETGVLATTDGIYRKLIEQWYFILMELNSPARVRILQPASHPTQKDTKKQILGTSFAGLLGFVLVGLGVVGYESVCRRVSSLADVRAAVPTPVVGVVPYTPGRAAERDPVQRAAANEAIDRLRAYVSQTWLNRGATSIVVTSPVEDEGKALTAFGLASSLAQAGYKTLLADFDLRAPALHTFAGVPNLVGACELLRGETDVRAAVQALPSGLHLLPAGKWSDEARKAATGERLEHVLAKLKEPYDCVVLHGHAILTAAESVEVARRCEVVLVCARYRETTTPFLKRAAERVATMEIPYTGVVYVGASQREALC